MEDKLSSECGKNKENEGQTLSLYNDISDINIPSNLNGIGTAIKMIESYDWNAVTNYINKISSYDWGAISNSVKRINSYDWSGLYSSIKKITDLYSKIDYSIVMNNICKSMSGVNASISRFIELYNSDAFRMSMDNIGRTLSSSIDSEFIEKINSIDITDVINKMPDSSIVDVANEIYNMAETNQDFEDDGITEEIVEEIISSTDSSELGWQERFHDTLEKYKKKYYVVFIVIYMIFKLFVEPFLPQTIGLPVISKFKCLIREQPSTDANVVIELQESDKAIITDDIKYYYKVEFTDENGEKKIGYVAKKNVDIIEEDN